MRKSPIRHQVSSYKRQGKTVHQYLRGQGFRSMIGPGVWYPQAKRIANPAPHNQKFEAIYTGDVEIFGNGRHVFAIDSPNEAGIIKFMKKQGFIKVKNAETKAFEIEEMCGGSSPCYAEVWQGTFQVGNNDFKIKVTDFEDEDEGEKHYFSMEDE